MEIKRVSLSDSMNMYVIHIRQRFVDRGIVVTDQQIVRMALRAFFSMDLPDLLDFAAMDER